MIDLQVWWIPQVPGTPYTAEVDSVKEGALVMKVLAEYDMFQYTNNIKPDYSNAGGLMMREDHTQEWEDWFDDATGEDDPEAYLERESDG